MLVPAKPRSQNRCWADSMRRFRVPEGFGMKKLLTFLGYCGLLERSSKFVRERMRALWLLAAAGIVFAQSPVRVVKQPAPDKALILEVAIPASRADVWQAFSTSDGLS